MYSNKKDNNNDGGQSDICRQRSRTRFQIPAVLFLVLVTALCLLTIKPTEAAAADTGPAQTEEAQTTATPDETAQANTTPESAPPESTPPEDSISPAIASPASVSPDTAELFAYNANIPLDSDIQQYLFNLCAERKLDYRMCLAVIKEESNFKTKALGGGSNYGLFQINKCNHKRLSAALETPNTPYDPITNINWGTYMLADLYEKYASAYTGENLLKAVLSAYNRGEGGFKKYGFAKSYIKGYYKALGVVETWFA